MKIINLLQKEIKLAGNYFWFSLLVLVGIMLFFGGSGNGKYSAAYILLTSVDFSLYFIFSNIFTAEDKYMGNIHILALPYGKIQIVVTKYILTALMYILAVGCYWSLSKIEKFSGIALANLSVSDVTVTAFAINLLISVFLPLYHRFSYQKIKVILAIIMIMFPTWGMAAVGYTTGVKLIYQVPMLSTVSLWIINLGSIGLLMASVGLSLYCVKYKEY